MESDTQKDFKTVLKECEEMSDKVKAYILLAVTDEKLPNGSQGGINSISGSTSDLVNLVLNIDRDLFRHAVIARAMSKASDIIDDDDDDERTIN